jgi:hypothetical protein
MSSRTASDATVVRARVESPGGDRHPHARDAITARHPCTPRSARETLRATRAAAHRRSTAPTLSVAAVNKMPRLQRTPRSETARSQRKPPGLRSNDDHYTRRSSVSSRILTAVSPVNRPFGRALRVACEDATEWTAVSDNVRSSGHAGPNGAQPNDCCSGSRPAVAICCSAGTRRPVLELPGRSEISHEESRLWNPQTAHPSR